MNLARMSRRGKDPNLDPKRNDAWFIGVLNELGIDAEQCETDKKNSNFNAKEIIYRKLKDYKTTLDKTDKDIEKANRIKQLIENFDLFYEYKYEIIKRLLFVKKPGETIRDEEIKALEEEANKIKENTDTSELRKAPIKGTTKWFYNKLCYQK
jgi:hypothetical protein